MRIKAGGIEGARLNAEKLSQYCVTLEAAGQVPPLGENGALDIKAVAEASGIARSAFYTRGGALKRQLERWWLTSQGRPVPDDAVEETVTEAARREIDRLTRQIDRLTQQLLVERSRNEELVRENAALKAERERAGELTKILLSTGRLPQ